MTKMLSLSSWTIVDPNLTLPLVVFIGILMGFMTLWVLSACVKVALVASGVAGTKCNLHTNTTHGVPCIDVY